TTASDSRLIARQTRLIMKPLLSPRTIAQNNPSERPKSAIVSIVASDVRPHPISSTIDRFQNSVKKCRLTRFAGLATTSAREEDGSDELLVARSAPGLISLMVAKTSRLVGRCSRTASI